jgi:hypothetical protein
VSVPDQAPAQGKGEPKDEGRGAIDPERSITITALVFFLKAIGFVVAIALAISDELALRGLIVPALLALATAGAGLGLLQRRRWAWLLALAVLIVDVTVVGGILRMLIDLGLVFLLVRPQVRARFGMR